MTDLEPTRPHFFPALRARLRAVREQLVPLDAPARRGRRTRMPSRAAPSPDRELGATADPARDGRALAHIVRNGVAVERVMRHAVEDTLRQLVADVPVRVASLLYPALAPALRRATRDAIRGLIQRTTDLRAYSLSRRARFRLEAWTSDRTVTELVVADTFAYRVEQVFLLHGPTGFLLLHALGAGEPAPVKEPMIVAGTLSAIQDFIRDSFRTRDDDGLDALHLGELVVWVEHGPLASLAIVVRGHAPQEELRNIMQSVLADVHRDYADALSSFHGDTTVFVETQPYLARCLRRS